MRVIKAVLLLTSLELVPAITAQPTVIAGAPRSYLGVMVQEIDGERAKTLKLSEATGVEITRVESDSPADKAGIKTGDVVLQYHGQPVDGIDQFSRMVRETPPGRDVPLEIFRNGATQTLKVKIGAHRSPVDGHFAFAPPMPPVPPSPLVIPDLPRSVLSWRSAVLGAEAESLEGQLAQYFGVNEGVLVRSVTKGSPAEKAGIKAGDVIVRVGDGKVSTPADVSSRLRALRGKPIPVTLTRDHKEVTVSVTLDDNDRAWVPSDSISFAR